MTNGSHDKRRHSSDGRVPIWVAVISGLSGVVATIAAAVITNASGAITIYVGSTDMPTTSTTIAPSVVVSTTKVVTQVTQPTDPSRVAAGVTVSVSYALDLDSAQPNWGVDTARMYGGTGDFGLTANSVTTVATPEDVVVVSGEPSASVCENSSERQYKVIRRDQLNIGSSFCIRTSEKRWAWVTVRAYTPNGGGLNSITLDIVVW